MDEEQRPLRKVVHDIGQLLDDLSVEELQTRIALLQIEIERLQSARSSKQKARDAAGSIFGRRPD